MANLTIDWTWKLTSPLHCGSGISRAGVADRLVQRVDETTPFVPGEAVKGALRMSAEQMLAWLGRPQTYYSSSAPDTNEAEQSPPSGTAEPRVEPLQYLFGGAADAHFSPARYTPAVGQSPFMVVASTRIDPESGTASDDMLRSVEVVAPGGTLEASLRVHVADRHTRAVSTLALGALAATEQIGAKAGIGWGRVEILSVRIAIDGQPQDLRDLTSESRIEELRQALDKSEAMDPPGQTTMQLGKPMWWEIRIDLHEPACFPTLPDVSNRVVTEEAIRASVIRGAALRIWTRNGLTRAQRQACLGAETRWLPALPIAADGKSLLVPAARSLMGFKREVPEPQRRVLFDALAPADPPKGDNDQIIPTRALEAAWIDPRTRDVVKVGKQMRMLVARDYLTGSHAPAALYARETLRPGMTYRTWAYLPEGAWNEGTPIEILLGKRTSAGNGRATLTAVRSEGPGFAWKRRTIRPDDHDVYVQLLSPAVIREADGLPLRTMSPADWETRYAPDGVRIDAVDFDDRKKGSAVSAAPGRRGGWMSTWRQPRSAVVTIDAGSSWRLRCRDHGQAQQLRTHLDTLQQIGERCHEGFGWLAVDPEWLGLSPTPLPNIHEPAPTSETPPRPWPGTQSSSAGLGIQSFDGKLHGELTRIAATVAEKFRTSADGTASKELRKLRNCRTALQRLAQSARNADASKCLELRNLCRVQADERERPGWAALSKGAQSPARDLLAPCWGEGDKSANPPLLRFTLDALITRALRTGETDHD